MTDQSPATTQPLQLSERTWFWIGFAGLYLISLLAFAPAMGGWFIWDDNFYVSENPAMSRGLEGMRQIWTGGADPDTYPGPQFYPMTFTSFWIEYQFWGTIPFGYHVTNILLHATAAMLLWIILRKLGVPGAWVCAAIFAIHPVQVESVAWITERKNVLSAVFYFLSALVYLRFCGLDKPRGRDTGVPPVTGASGIGETPMSHLSDSLVLPSDPWKLYSLSLLLFVCALLSKSVTGSLPAVMLLVIWWKRARIDLKIDVLPLVPFVLLALGMGWVTSWYEAEKVGAQGAEWAFSWTDRLLIAGRALWFYVLKLIAPFNLVFIYPKWNVDAHEVWQFAFPVLAIAVPIVLFALRNRIGRGPVVAVLFFGGTLVPALGFFNVFPMRYSYVADHFQYLACVGLIVLSVAALYGIINSHKARVVVSSIVLVVLGALTLRQCRVYYDIKTLWDDVIARNPDSWMAHNNLGTWYFYQATQFSQSREERADNFNRAIQQYQLARDLKKKDLGTDHMEAVMSIGVIFERTGKLDRAITWYKKSADLIPKEGKRFAYYAEPYFHLGVASALNGQDDQAIEYYQKALELNPRHLLALNNLGNLMFERNKLDEAIELLRRAIEVAPEFAGAHLNLGNVYDRAGKPVEAAEQWREAMRLAPRDEKAYIQIGSFLASNGKFREAETYFRKAVELNSRSAIARTDLAIVLIKTDRPAEAIDQLRVVLDRIDPNFELAKRNLAIATTMPTSRPATQPSQ